MLTEVEKAKAMKAKALKVTRGGLFGPIGCNTHAYDIFIRLSVRTLILHFPPLHGTHYNVVHKI